MSDNFSLRAIMKTDVKDFTKKFNEMSEQEISAIMSEHRQFVLNKAYKFTGKIIKGEGDATASSIYAKAYSQDKEFYDFYRSLEAYKNSLNGKDDILVLDPSSEFFKYLRGPNKK